MSQHKKVRDFLRYYGFLISEEYDWIKGFDNHNIDNDELDLHFDLLLDHIISANDKIIEILEEYESNKVT